MALAFFLPRDGKPTKEQEEPKVFVRNNLSSSVVAFVDFLPGLVRLPTSGVLTTDVLKDIEFTDIRTMMDSVNKWLKENIEWQAINCETVVFMKKTSDGFDLKNDDTCFYDFAFQNKYVLRCLRLWIQRRKRRIAPDEYQEVNFIDFVPVNKSPESSKPDFETKEELMAKINEKITSKEIPGRVMNIQMFDCEADLHWNFQTMRTLQQQYSGKCVYIFRAFYECDREHDGLIEVQDFQPITLSEGSFFRKAKFESSSDYFKRVEDWITQQSIKRIVNVQTICLPTDSKGNVDSSSVIYTTPGDLMMFSRLFYVKSNDSEADVKRKIAVTQFIPSSNKEPLANLVKRINDKCIYYFKSSETAELICGESLAVYSRRGTIKDLQKEANKSVYVLRFELNTGYNYFLFRIWFDVENSDK